MVIGSRALDDINAKIRWLQAEDGNQALKDQTYAEKTILEITEAIQTGEVTINELTILNGLEPIETLPKKLQELNRLKDKLRPEPAKGGTANFLRSTIFHDSPESWIFLSKK